MSKIKAHMNERVLPGCEKYVYGSDLYWECYLRHLTVTAYHPVGSCKMGRDKESVVDYDLR
jgi:choline dehydrogenase